MTFKKGKIIQKRAASVVLLLALAVPTVQVASAMDVDTFIYGSIFENDEVKMPNDKMIYTREDLKRFRDSVNKGNSYKGETIYLCEDIDLEKEPFEPIGNKENAFNGSFESYGEDNKKISGLVVEGKSFDTGLFGKIEGAHIKNIDAEAICKGEKNVGILVGEAIGSKIENCNTEGFVTGKSNVGGMIGKLYNSCIEGCQSWVSAKGESCVGGIIGSSNSSIVRFLISNGKGCIIGNDKVGGIAGKSLNDTIECVTNKNNIKGAMYVGGIIGDAFCSQFADCYNNAYVKGSGKNEGNIGGIIGAGQEISCLNCFNDKGAVITGKGDIGGIAGFARLSKIKGSFNRGEIRGHNDIGGIVGRCETMTMENCGNKGKVTGRKYLGNFCGSVSKQILLKCFQCTDKDKESLFKTLFGNMYRLSIEECDEGLLLVYQKQ